VQWVFVSLTARNSAVGIKGIEINSVPGRLHPFGGITPLLPTRHDVEDLPSFYTANFLRILYVCRGRQRPRALLDALDNSGAFQIV
jgi:hypothetical protein